MKSCFERSQAEKHASKFAVEDIWSMMLNLAFTSLCKLSQDRFSLHSTVNLYITRLERLNENILKYNQQHDVKVIFFNIINNDAKVTINFIDSIINKLIIKFSFNINLLTRLEYSISTFWLDLFRMSNDRQLWLSLFLKRKLSENLGTENWLSLFSEADYHLTFWADFLQNFRSYSFQSAVFTNIISNSTASNCIFRKMLNVEILENFASADQFEHQNHQFPPPGLIYARWLPHILWET